MSTLYNPADSDAAYAPIGHNRPNLSELLSSAAIRFELGIATEALVARRDAMVTMCGDFASDHPEITSDEDAATATDVVRQARACAKQIEEARVSSKEPFLQAGRVVDAFFTPIKARLLEVIEPIQKAKDRRDARIVAFKMAKAAEEAKAAAERARQAEEAARASATPEVFDRAIAAAEEAATAEAIANAKPADLTRIRTDLGGVSSAVQEWHFDVLDVTLLRPEFLLANLSAINQAIRRRDNPLRESPGLRIYSVIKSRSR